MPTSHENALQQRCQQIVTSPVLSPEQKRHFLALEAENNLPYPLCLCRPVRIALTIDRQSKVSGEQPQRLGYGMDYAVVQYIDELVINVFVRLLGLPVNTNCADFSFRRLNSYLSVK